MNPPRDLPSALFALLMVAWGLFAAVSGRWVGPRPRTSRGRRGHAPPTYVRTIGAVTAAFGAYLSLFALGLVD